MSDFKKTTLLQKYTILQATLDYMIKHHSSTVVCDDEDPVMEMFQRGKMQAEKDYQEKNSSKLKYQLDRWLRMLERKMDLNYTAFIKEQTGFAIDLFENIRTLADTFNTKTELNSQQDLYDCNSLMQYYEKTNTNTGKKKRLEQLSQDYVEKNFPPHTYEDLSQYSTELSSIQNDDNSVVVTLTYITTVGGPKPKDFKSWAVASPDHHKQLIVQQETFAKTATTSVQIYTKENLTPIYSIEGIHNINVSWKDDSTILLQTKNEYRPTLAVKKVSYPTETIYIEYLT